MKILIFILFIALIFPIPIEKANEMSQENADKTMESIAKYLELAFDCKAPNLGFKYDDKFLYLIFDCGGDNGAI